METSFAKYAQKRLKRLKAALREFQKRTDLELLHQARVEIKKIKALINLIGHARPRFKAHAAYVPFRNIHRASGKLWEPEVTYQLMKQYSIPVSRTNPGKEVKKFRSLHDSFIKTIKNQSRILLPETQKINKKHCKGYLKKKKLKVRKLIADGIPISLLHPIRKQLKELYYLQSIHLKPKLIDSIYRQAERHIGHWLDQKLLITKLKRVKANASIIAVLQTEMKTELKEIRTELKTF